MVISVHNITSSVPQPYGFEKTVDRDTVITWMKYNWHYSIYCSILYVILIFSIKYYMKTRSSFDLQKPLIAWNLLLAIFSTIGAFRMFPGLLHVITEFGFTFSVCDTYYIRNIQPTVFWAWLFILSKVIELGDTLFIVLRKRNLTFLHWYHHIMTLMMCWYTTGNLVAVTHWFGVMNYTVHSLMYTYYTLSALNIMIPRRLAMILTSLQLLQMIIGCYACIWAIGIKYRGHLCDFPDSAVRIALVVYLTYVFLFARFFYVSYGKRRCNLVKCD